MDPYILLLYLSLKFSCCQVCDYDLIGGGDPIGKIKLGWSQNKEYKPGFKHWKEALENPRRPIIKWHVLQVTKKEPLNFLCLYIRTLKISILPISLLLNISYISKLIFIL